MLLGFCVAPTSAPAQPFRQLILELSDPKPPLGPLIDKALAENSVGGVPLSEYLPALEFTGCLDEVRAELVAGLGALRRVHVNAVERRRLQRVWAIWERKLADLSPDAWLLTTTWLDSPEVARRLYMCEDGLPPSWKALDPDGYVREAVTWFDLAVADREPAILKGAPADRELAIMELVELKQALLDRFGTTYPNQAEYSGASGRLDERLEMMWEILVEPHHYGFTPRARTVDPVANPDSHRRAMPQSPFVGISIPDPGDSRARDRVVESWRRQRRIIDAELKERGQAMDQLTAAMGSEEELRALDRLVRQAARLEAEMSNARVDLVRMQNRIRHFSTGKPWIDSMLSAGWRRRNANKLDRRDDKIEAQTVEIHEAVAAAVARGATPPPRWEGSDGTAAAAVAAARVKRGEAGPGNWLAGIPVGTGVGAALPERGAGIPEGTGAVERIFEGPLPLPSAVWSLELVDEMVARHPTLDRTDVRILLGLVQSAYRELPDRAAVEDAVWRTLNAGELHIRGEESTLSDLWIPGRSRADQRVVTFVLTLTF
jgi:hypothetical protein